ncbi:citramalate synthase [Oceanithermus sp.]
MGRVTILDTLLRDGALSEGVSFTPEDKIEILQLLDRLEIPYLEAGWPYQWPEDLEVFERARELDLKGKLVVFGSTRRPETDPERDPNLKAVLKADTEVVHIYGKAWSLHVEKVLRTTLAENLAMVRETIAYLKGLGKEVIFTAEHFYDGCRHDRGYSLEVVAAAVEAGADIVVLGDSVGASLMSEAAKGVRSVKEAHPDVVVGFHGHNDMGLAVANAIVAVEAGAEHVQGTIGGYGARTGMTDLSTLLPILKLKMGIDVISDEALKNLTPVTRAIVNKIGVGDLDYHPFVGYKVFAHRTHSHIAAVLSDPETYEPIPPEAVGNERRLLLPGIARASYLESLAQRFGVDLSEDSAANQRIREELLKLEEAGYTYEDAEASLELVLGKLTGRFHPSMNVERLRLFEVIRGKNQPVVEASLRIQLGSQDEYVAAEGTGPVMTLFEVLLGALREVRGQLGPLEDYVCGIKLAAVRVRTFYPRGKQELRARVTVTFTDGERNWSTIGISRDLIQATWQALFDGIEYGLYTKAEAAGIEPPLFE